MFVKIDTGIGIICGKVITTVVRDDNNRIVPDHSMIRVTSRKNKFYRCGSTMWVGNSSIVTVRRTRIHTYVRTIPIETVRTAIGE